MPGGRPPPLTHARQSSSVGQPPQAAGAAAATRARRSDQRHPSDIAPDAPSPHADRLPARGLLCCVPCAVVRAGCAGREPTGFSLGRLCFPILFVLDLRVGGARDAVFGQNYRRWAQSAPAAHTIKHISAPRATRKDLKRCFIGLARGTKRRRALDLRPTRVTHAVQVPSRPFLDCLSPVQLRRAVCGHSARTHGARCPHRDSDQRTVCALPAQLSGWKARQVAHCWRRSRQNNRRNVVERAR